MADNFNIESGSLMNFVRSSSDGSLVKPGGTGCAIFLSREGHSSGSMSNY